jgi:hypothetical protein
VEKTFKIFVLSLSFFVIFFVQCKKEDEPLQIEINITGPAPNSSYAVNDTVKLTLTVVSPRPTVTLYVTLVGNELEPVSFTNTVMIPDFETGKESGVLYVLDNEDLATGNYNLRVKASAEDNTVYAYRRIYITGLPREFKGFFIVSSENSGQVGIERFDAGFSSMLKRFLQGNYAGSDINDADQLVYVAGKNLGNLSAMTADSLKTLWEVPLVPNTGQPYFTFIREIDRILYTGFFDGRVEGYDDGGDLSFSAATNGLTIPMGAGCAGDILVVLSVSTNNVMEHWLETYFIPSGAPNSKTTFLGTPLYLKTQDQANVLLFGNDTEGNFKTRLFNPLTGLLTDPYQPFELPEKEMLCTAGMDSGRTLIGVADGIYIYTDQESIVRITDAVSPQLLRWEPLGRTIRAAASQEIYLFSEEGTIISQTTYPKPVLNLLLYYNK